MRMKEWFTIQGSDGITYGADVYGDSWRDLIRAAKAYSLQYEDVTFYIVAMGTGTRYAEITNGDLTIL